MKRDGDVRRAIAGAILAAIAVSTPPPAALAAKPDAPAVKPTAEGDEAFRKAEDFSQHGKHAEAMRWYRVAADRGNPRAEVAIGNFYMEGQGVAKNPAEAMRWFRRAAENGDAEAENDVGLLHLMGMGVKQDSVEAARWLRKSAEQGNEVAERNLGVMYVQGMGVKQDREEGLRWLRRSAGHGDPDAKAALKALGAQ
jgi:TPR repeat protein